MILDLYTLDRQTLKIKDYIRCAAWEINRDYLTAEQSTFDIGIVPIAITGDFVIAKEGEPGTGALVTSGGMMEGFRPLFVGVIDSFENRQISAGDLYTLINFEFPAVRLSGTDVADHLRKLLNKYLFGDPSKIVHINDVYISSSGSSSHTYQPDESPTATSLQGYFINAFNKYNVVWDYEFIYQDGDQLDIFSSIKKVDDFTTLLNLKSNTYYLVNWDIYYTPQGRDIENKLEIYMKDTAAHLSTWYMQMDGTLTQSFNDHVHCPTKTKVYVFDPPQQDPPTYLEIAQSELAVNMYTHEINVDMLKDNPLIGMEDIKIGRLCNIVHDGSLYKSVLTGYTLTADSSFISLKFGNVRSTLQSVLLGGK